MSASVRTVGLAWIVLLAVALLDLPSSRAGEKPAGAERAGRAIAPFTLKDYVGKEWSLDDFRDSRVVVVAFLGNECPLVGHYAGRLVELHGRYKDRGVAFVGINANQQDSLAAMAHFARTRRVEFPLLKDAGNRVADQFAAERTPEVFVLDADRKVRYVGRIDDQYTYGVQRPRATREYLAEALDALLAGKSPSTASTETVGCLIGRVFTSQKPSEVTYSRQISRILQNRCVECHRPGQIGPFSLTSYREVVGWAEMIDEVVQQRRMPPWHADPKYGHFANDARLAEEDRELIRRWVAAGAPEGDPAELPPPRKFAEGWQIGRPDKIIYMADKPFQVPARGEVKYQYFIVDPGFTDDMWIAAAECRPGNRAVVHHIIVGVLTGDRRLVGSAEDRSDWLAATAPGARPLLLGEGYAKLIPAGAKLVFQLHYTPNGTAQEDRSSIGLVFADPATVKRIVTTQKAATRRLVIPPGDPNHRVDASHVFASDTLLMAMFPHMHLRGKSFRYTAVYPDGKGEILLDVPRYDFNWQNSYELVEPKLMPKGTRLECVAHFDNSESNLANPDPTATVRWGDQTWEEMMIGYFAAAPAEENAPIRSPNPRTREFLRAAAATPPKFDGTPAQLAGEALASDASLLGFGVELKRTVPQLDRVCLITVAEETYRVERVAQHPLLAFVVGGSGVTVPATNTGIAACARGRATVVHAKLAAVEQSDLAFMARRFGSSMHVPLTYGGKPAVVSFWSQEREAFPEPAVKLLEEAARALAAGK
jgi:peroxiredoxin